MLNLEYLQEGKIRATKKKAEPYTNNKTLSLQEKEFYRTDIDQQKKNNHRKHKRIIYAVCYDVLTETLNLQQAQDAFLREIEGKRMGHVANAHKNRTERKLINIDGQYYLQHNIGSCRQIWLRFENEMTYATVSNTLQLLKHMNMIEYDLKIKSYRVLPKGIEFMVIYEDLIKVFPHTYYKDIYNKDLKQQEEE